VFTEQGGESGTETGGRNTCYELTPLDQGRKKKGTLFRIIYDIDRDSRGPGVLGYQVIQFLLIRGRNNYRRSCKILRALIRTGQEG
jgi:hypothetical protein